MEKRTLGIGGLQVSAIGFGCMGMSQSYGPNPGDRQQMIALLRTAVDRGGIAPGVTIYNYKVLSSNRLLNGDSFSGALAIQQALEDGADIANCSWGAGPVGATKSREAIAVDTAWALGMVVVKSAGNAGPRRATMTTPADADGVVVVGATDLAGSKITGYSSRGPAGPNTGPHVVAPGGSDAGNIACCLVTGGFGDAGQGTSYAAPHVAGAMALLVDETRRWPLTSSGTGFRPPHSRFRGRQSAPRARACCNWWSRTMGGRDASHHGSGRLASATTNAPA